MAGVDLYDVTTQQHMRVIGDLGRTQLSNDMATGWHARHGEWQTGPVSWSDLVAHARGGTIVRDSHVWHPSLATWVIAGSVPGLFEAVEPALAPVQVAPEPIESASPQPAAPVIPQPAAPSTPLPAPTQPPTKKRGCGIAVGIAAVVILLAVLGAAAWFFLLRDGASLSLGTKAGPSMGVAQATLPSPDDLIVTEQWGEVPSNHVMVALTEGEDRSRAEAVAEELGGEIVGEVEFIGLYQVLIQSTSEAELIAAIAAAEAMEGVDAAYPLDQIQLDAEIWGVRLDPYADPMYGGDAGAGYRAVGVSKAWSYIKGAGVDLNDVKVGICDSGLYVNGEGAESEFGGDVQVEHPDAGA